MSIAEQIRALEEQLLQPDVRKTAARLDALLAEEFIEFGSSGRVFDKHGVIETLGAESSALRWLVDFKAIPLERGGVPCDLPRDSLRRAR